MNGESKDRTAIFNPQVFEVATLDQALAIALTAEPGTTTQERFEKETPFLVEDIGKHLRLGSASCVLDYGCGSGRVAKGLIDKFGCRVIGVDASQSMRLLAPEYVLSERFTIWSPEILDKMIAKGFQADGAISLWVIQHVFDPPEVIDRLARALPTGGLLYALNGSKRCVPTDKGWVDDGYDLRSGLRRFFEEDDFHKLPDTVATPLLSGVSMIQVLRKPGKGAT